MRKWMFSNTAVRKNRMHVVILLLIMMLGTNVYAEPQNAWEEPFPATLSPQIYYVSSSEGNDVNSGLSSSAPWKSLSKVSSVSFNPGDSVLLKRGDTWTGETLYLHGSGTSSDWIKLSAYGSGDRPMISPYLSPEAVPAPDPSSAANNGLLYAIKLSSTAGWKISGLEIANSRSGIVYINDAPGTRDGLWVEDCYIHDITKWPLSPYPAAENRDAELQVMPYSVGIYTFLQSGERLQNVTVKNTVIERTDGPLEIRHADRVTIDSITALDSYREGIQLTGINYDYPGPGQPEGSLTNSRILRSGLHGMAWGTAGLQFNAVHDFVADHVEIGYTVSPNSPDGVGIDFEGLNKNVTVKNSYIHDNEDEAVMYYRNPIWSGGIDNVNTSLIDNLFENNGIKNDGVHAAFLVHQYNADNGGTISGNTIVKAYPEQPLNMVLERNPKATELWPSGSYNIFGNVVKLPNGNVIHNASTQFNGLQGENGWYYQQFDGSGYSDMQWDAVQEAWQGITNALSIGEDWQSASNGIDSVRKWISPSDGRIRITGKAKNSASTFEDGVKVSVLKNDIPIWGPYPITGVMGLAHDIELDVTSGDRIYFVVQSNGSPSQTRTNWSPFIEEIVFPSNSGQEEEELPVYKASSDYSNVQGNNQWRYDQASGTDYSALVWNADYGLWEGTVPLMYVADNWQHPSDNMDSVRTWEAPENGTIAIKGTAKKRDSESGDGVNISILKNGELLWTQLVTSFTGASHDLEAVVNKGDLIRFIVNCNEETSYDVTLWDPSVTYSHSLTKRPVITLAGNNPLVVEMNDPFIEPGYQAQDQFGADLTAQVQVTGSVRADKIGTYNLFYNSADSNHLVARTVTRTVYVRDTTAPSITIDAPVNGSYSDAESLLPAFNVSDAGSGVDPTKTTVTLDGTPIQHGTNIKLYSLPLGSHTLTVIAQDFAGNTGTASVTFETTANLSSLKALVAAFRVNGWIGNHGIANSLTKKLEHGNLQAFLNEVQAQSGKHIQTEAAGYLIRDAQALLDL
ncbi:immunoglobulin-like domain-containing protein [Paenibacillus contaminans]|nr:immunoglobulin-like domain-containing protein [Paenibacillus contaminans]